MLAVVAGAVALAIAFLVMRARRRGAALPVVAIALVAIAGWLALDLRWQTLLARKHAAVIAEGFGRSTDERNAAMDDGALFEVARRIRDADRARGGRVLVLSDNTSLATRVGWFLYPDNVYYDVRPLARQRTPPPDALRPGDQVVLLLYRPPALGPGARRARLARRTHARRARRSSRTVPPSRWSRSSERRRAVPSRHDPRRDRRHRRRPAALDRGRPRWCARSRRRRARGPDALALGYG